MKKDNPFVLNSGDGQIGFYARGVYLHPTFSPADTPQLKLPISGRPGCNGTIEITEGPRIVDRICSRSVDNSQPRFHYNLTATPVRLKYYTLRGQMQSTPDIGFWLSYRQVRGESGR